jgi:hypothetical protein
MAWRLQLWKSEETERCMFDYLFGQLHLIALALALALQKHKRV